MTDIKANVGADEADGISRVFLSYSRKDREQVKPLLDKLRAAGLTVLRDADDILPTEEWRERLEDLITQADQVVFALSPHSAVSEECNWEIEVSTRLNKRIAPVVVAELGDAKVPEALSRLNYIFLTPPADYDASIDSLLKALKLDIDWVREHARLGEIANRWHGRSHAKDVLLRGKALEQAEQWLQTPSGDAPPPTQLHRDFISGSRRDETSRTRRNVLVLGGLLVLSLLAGAVAWVQYGVAQYQTKRVINTTSLAAWQPLEDPKAACINMRQYTGQEGLRALYCHIKDMLNYRTVEQLAGMPVFLSGPHHDGKLLVQEGEFGHYNPEFVEWFHDNLIPAPDNSTYINRTQGLYTQYLRDMVRAYHRSYIQFTHIPEALIHERQYLMAMVRGERPWSYMGARWQDNTIRELLGIDADKEGLNWYHLDTAIRFWQRRSIDGTAGQFYELLAKLATAYDAEWLQQQPEPKGLLPAAGKTTDWTHPMLPEPRGDNMVLNGDVFGGVLE